MNNLLSYCGLVDARIRASNKNLPVLIPHCTMPCSVMYSGSKLGRRSISVLMWKDCIEKIESGQCNYIYEAGNPWYFNNLQIYQNGTAYLVGQWALNFSYVKIVAFIAGKKSSNPKNFYSFHFSLENLIANISFYALSWSKLNFGCYLTFENYFVSFISMERQI